MGQIAARTLLGRIDENTEYEAEIAVAPEFVVRKSTAVAIPTHES
jgi:DNA-binding LacI/PurR family transcriptional regulator